MRTPLTLNEAIRNGVRRAVGLPSISLVGQQGAGVIEADVRDFLAQKFGVAYMRASNNPEALQILEELFAKVTKEIAEEYLK